MRLTGRLVLAFVLVGLFAAGLSAFLGNRAAQGNVQRFLRDQGLIEQTGRPQFPRPREGGPPTGFRGPPPRQDREQLLARLRDSHAQTALLAVLVAVGAGGFLAHRLVRPIRHLTEVQRRFAHGDRGARAAHRGSDEIAELAASFNHMADQIGAREERERRMVADIAHELRTPLTVLKGELESLQDGLLEPRPEVFGRLVEEVDLLERLVQDLRLLSLAEAGQLRPSLRPVDLAEVAGAALAAFAPKAEAKKVRLEGGFEPLPGQADPERVRQILYNLLDNALRHTPEGGAIRVSAAREGDWAVLQVADSGPGIPPEHLPHLFDRFYRADPARGREAGGSGLGLAIVKALAEAHGGSAGAANRAAGGAVFTVRLPLQPHG